MDTIEREDKTGIKYMIRKYGRITIIFSVLMIALLSATGNTPDIGIGNVSFGDSRDDNVAIQGSKHVNPPLQSEYWTSNKFKF